MKNFIGIDLGTSNSAISSFNGEEVRIWKSPEQNDVTPSVIYFDQRGNKYVGKRAYDSAPHSPDSAASLFKRYMGTSTPIKLSEANVTMSPEECSSEILKTLNGYLPEEIRKDEKKGTVVTVPAAFNQMQKTATMQAVDLSGIGQVALMQEPVAAVMSVMQSRKADGIFVIYDLGGGTLDVAIAESIKGKISLLAHGGIAMCGGRDFDKVILNEIVKPWLDDNFDIPHLSGHEDYKSLTRLALWAVERSKIELSSKDESHIILTESEARLKDQSDNEIYIDINLERKQLDKLIEKKVDESVHAVRETIDKVGLNSSDLDRIVFIGGPTNYKPLRDKVSFELGLPSSSEVNPMTAVSEGASVFAESIEWKSKSRGRKSKKGKIKSDKKLDITFNYTARTPETKAKIVAKVGGSETNGYEFQLNNLDDGWSSGNMELKDNASTTVSLTKNGENTFKVLVFDSSGGSAKLDDDKIVINRTAASIDAIPASHSIGIEVLEKVGGVQTIEWLIKSGDQLPLEGNKKFKAGESLKSGSNNSLNFRLFEGESDDPKDNRIIGVLKISGGDFDEGEILTGADLNCKYEMLDSGNIILAISIPSISSTFPSGQNFYSRQEGQMDYKDSSTQIMEEAEDTKDRIDEISEITDDQRLNDAEEKLKLANELEQNESDEELAQEAMENIYEARKILASVRKDNLKEIRKRDLDKKIHFFNEYLREIARPSEVSSFDNLVTSAKRSLKRNDKDFDSLIDDISSKTYEILYRQDWYIKSVFENFVSNPHRFTDRAKFDELVELGNTYIESEDIESLKSIVGQLWQIQIVSVSDDRFDNITNIIRG